MADQTSNGGDVLKAPQAACKGLLWPSESDKPIRAFYWPSGSVSEAGVRAGDQLPDSAVVTAVDASALFEPLMAEQSWFGDAEKATAARFRALFEVLKGFSGLAGFEVTLAGGASRVVYVVGTVTGRGVAGIKAEVVET